MKQKYSRFRIFTFLSLPALMFSLLYLGACALDNSEEETDRLSYSDVELSLVDITDADSYSRSVPGWTRGDAVARAVSAPGGAVIKLVAEVDPPEDAQGRLLQASHVALSSNGQYAAVGYMLRGDEASGAIDVFNISNPSKPKLQSTHFFPGFDIAAVLVESGSLFLAGQTPDQSGDGRSARVVSLDFSNSGVVSLSSEKSVQLPGYFATDLSREDDVLFVTTGTYSSNQTAVGIYALDTETLETSESVTAGYPDARSVVSGGSDVAIFEAQYSDPASNCRLDIYADGELESAPASIDLSAYPATAEAKAKSAYFEDAELYLVAANRSGIAIVDARRGTLKAGIPAPGLAGSLVPPENQSSNAVSMGDAGGRDIVLIANGEAGLWVGDGNLVRAQTTSSTSSINGSIRFGSGESVNFVASRNTLAVAAVGTGGLKMLTIQVPR